MDKMRKISIIWGSILVLLFIALTIFGIAIKNKDKGYKELENKMVEATKKYVELNFLYPQGEDKVKVTDEELKGEKLIDELEYNNDKCEGYVLVYLDTMVYKYDAYIKCDNYVTDGFK